MNNKFLKITFAVFISLAVIAAFMWLGEKDSTPSEVSKSNLSVDLADYTKESVNKIAIKKGEEEKVLAFRDEKWYIGEEEADEEKINQLFADFKNMSVKETASENEANHAKFEVNKDTGYQLTLTQDGKETIFYIGKMGAGSTDFYIRKNGIKNVYLASGTLREKMTWETSQWKKETEEEKNDEEKKEGEDKEAQES